MAAPPADDGRVSYPVLDVGDASSDYGSDFDIEEEQLLNNLLSTFTVPIRSKRPNPAAEDEADQHGRRKSGPAIRALGRIRHGVDDDDGTDVQLDKAGAAEPLVEMEGDSGEATDAQSSESGSGGEVKADAATETELSVDVVDGRSPLERFRTAPKKPLSVTDLISPAWCELQYWYSLTRHGRKLRTAAMKAGTVVHKALEDQVHHTVTVEIKTREDSWGIRIWNVIQSLRLLRNTGITREMEIWGVIDGCVVNGVIDQLSHDPPEEVLEVPGLSKTAKNARGSSNLSSGSLDAYFKSAELVGLPRDGPNGTLQQPSRKVYITDVKTRGAKALPSGASFRPTVMQLMIYHRLLSDLASNKVDPDVLFSRYQLDGSAKFSDSFVAEVANLNDQVFYDAPTEQSQETRDSSQDSLDLLLENNSLRQLWALMIRSFKQTFPAGRDSISDILQVEYRSPTDASIQAIKTFRYEHDKIQTYLDDEMSWWKGEREAVGVPIEEAYKCRFCEFADTCTWRNGKVDDAIRTHRTRSTGRVVPA